MPEPMAPERFTELRRLRGKWPTPPLTVEPHQSGNRHACDACGNIVAAIPPTAGEFGDRIVEALGVIPELLNKIARLRLARRVTSPEGKACVSAAGTSRRRSLLSGSC